MTNNALRETLIAIASILVSVAVAYITAKYAVRREYGHGRLRLLDLTRRYFMHVVSACDLESGKIRQDELSKRMYVEGLRSVMVELGELVAHPYFTTLVGKYPLISKVLVMAQRELVEHEYKKELSINSGTLAEFYRLHQILLKDLPKRIRADEDDQIDQIAERSLRGLPSCQDLSP